MDISAAFIDGPDGEQQLLVRGAFEYVSGCAVLQYMEQIFLVVMHRQNQDFGIRIILLDLAGRNQPALTRRHA
ncbi:hypothetical protein D3C73_1542520 [compost metagenome]